MRLLISAVTWDEFLRSGMCQLELVPLAEKYDCSGIEFRPYWRSPIAELPEIKDFLAEYGLISTYACNECLLGEHEQKIHKAFADLENSLIFAQKLGANILRVNVASGPFDRSLLEEKWWKNEVRRIIARAEELNIMLAVENPPEPQSGAPDLLRDIVEPFGSPWLRVAFDTGNWLPAGWEPEQALEMLKDLIGYVHLKDMLAHGGGYTPTHLGNGALDLRALAGQLEQTGYDGFCVLEFPGGKTPAALVKASLKYLRQG